MPWNPDYITLAELKAHLGISDAGDDTALQTAISAASAAINHYTGRQFGLLAAAAPRYYGTSDHRGRRHRYAEIDDLMTTTSLVVKIDTAGDGTYATTLTLDTDYRLSPPNAAADGFPWTMLEFAPGVSVPCGTDFPDRVLEVMALFGWSAVPGAVVQAAFIQAERFFIRKNSPYGIAGSPELGSEMRLLARLDPDVQLGLAEVRRYWGAV